MPPTCSQKLDGPYDNRVLPVIITVVLMTFLTVVWIGSIVRWVGCRGGGVVGRGGVVWPCAVDCDSEFPCCCCSYVDGGK